MWNWKNRKERFVDECRRGEWNSKVKWIVKKRWRCRGGRVTFPFRVGSKDFWTVVVSTFIKLFHYRVIQSTRNWKWNIKRQRLKCGNREKKRRKFDLDAKLNGLRHKSNQIWSGLQNIANCRVDDLMRLGNVEGGLWASFVLSWLNGQV